MKFCQDKNKITQKIVIISIIIAFFVIFPKKIVFAQYSGYSLGGGSSGGAYSGASLGGTSGASPYSLNAIHTTNPTLETGQSKGLMEQIKEFAQKIGLDKFLFQQLPAAGSKALDAAIRNALNKIAFDTATWLGSGNNGQKPMFIKEGWGTYLSNVADQAGGDFIEQLGKQWNANLCQPNTMVKVQIGLGLIQYQRPSAPSCTFTQMEKDWSQELERRDFLTRFQDMFNPASNDLGIALTLQSDLISKQQQQQDAATKDRQENGGWLDIRNIAGERVSPPGEAQRRLGQTTALQTQTFGEFTGSAIVDAANVFLNQLAISLFNNLMSKLGQNLSDYTSPYTGNYGGLTNANASPESGGIAGAQAMFKKLVQPQFNVQGDYDVLAELANCPDPSHPGPTDCVITDKFRQAIANKETVEQAIQDGSLNAQGKFGFIVGDNLEPNFKDESYPYRSMMILRKFRIVPVGWEVAAQYIKMNVNNNPDIAQHSTLGDMVACFDPNDNIPGYSANWCKGLVDPNWVLKAPLNYCLRQGPGPQIMSSQVVGEGADSQLAITRNDQYCADEQSCIQENDDGSCKTYGYCTEEKRTWNFGSDNSCDAIYNSCQTFKGASGQTVSYLKDSLNYSDCSASSAGCAEYCQDYDYGAQKWTCTASSTGKLYFDNNAQQCAADGEGCHEFIRTAAGLGANYLKNSSFENDLTVGGWSTYGTQLATTSYDGSYALLLNTGAGLDKTVDVYNAVGGETFTLSFRAKNCGLGHSFYIEDQNASSTLYTNATDWTLNKITYTYPAGQTATNARFVIQGDNTCLIDAIKLEQGSDATAYSDYGQNGVIYEKLMPNYLTNVCSAATNTPAVCDNFVKTCDASAVGCEMYTSTADNMSIPAKVTASDYCPEACNGYDTYVQEQSSFDSARSAYFIPSSAQTCTADAVGCDEFTNLDKIGTSTNAEAKEYYSSLKQCIKPDSSCSEFYTWEGSDETGYQLKVFELKGYDLNGTLVPAMTDGNYTECTYGLHPGDPGYDANKDCLEFYNKNGNVSHYLSSKTISCSDNCHPYRRTLLNYDPSVTQTDCTGTDKHWDGSAGECVVCLNGGTWSDSNNACVYQAIPGEGQLCSASQAGCREYTGNTGNNTMTILSSDFEGSTDGWTGNLDPANPSTESLYVGGHSLKVDGGTASIIVGPQVTKDKSYVLTFLAKSASGNVNLSAGIADAQASSTFSSGATLTTDWQTYKLDLPSLDHDVTNDESLNITGNGVFYLDNVVLTEIVDRYYLIENSWHDNCSYQNADPSQAYVGPMYYLGCGQYQDSNNQTLYLHSFSQLCSSADVGCESMIDTKNTDSNINDDTGINVVYDQNKLCGASDKGCQFLGKGTTYNGQTVYQDIYLINNPDNYSQISCNGNNPNDASNTNYVGCQSWTDNQGQNYYFKDPGDTACEYRQANASSTMGWYKKKISRCDTNSDGAVTSADPYCLSSSDCATVSSMAGTTCQSNADCGANNSCVNGVCRYSCIQDPSDQPCPTSNLLTMGTGGASIDQPAQGWAGYCPASESSCTEYVDPISKPGTNIVFNPDCSDLDNNPGNGCDGWDSPLNNPTQTINVDMNTLYVLSGDASVSCAGNPMYQLSGNNLNFVVSVSATAAESSRFYTGNNTSCVVTNTNPVSSNTVSVKKAIINYELASNVDKTSCNGNFDFNNGCILFNERSWSASGPAALSEDANLAYTGSTNYSNCSGNDCDSNSIVKVNPDRVCDKWLACKSMAQIGQNEKACYDIGVCNSFGNDGTCNNFVNTPTNPQPDVVTFSPIPGTNDASNNFNYSNVDGYSKVGINSIDDSNLTGLDPVGYMTQQGEAATVPNGSFEFYGDNLYPMGWTPLDINGNNTAWDVNKFSVINNPIAAQTDGIGYPVDGKAFLKFSPSSGIAESEQIIVEPNVPYVISAELNTINFHSSVAGGQASVWISVMDENNNTLTSVSLDQSKDWTQLTKEFTTNSSSRIKIRIQGTSDGYGNAYADNIQIMPALAVNNSSLTNQTCRLYPQDDSLSCQYFDNSGKYEEGWPGYCLQYDRAPGDPNSCILWYPVDRVKGNGIEEGAGYQDKIPAYYTTEGTTAAPKYEYRHAFLLGNNASWEYIDPSGNGNNGTVIQTYCPNGYIAEPQSCHWHSSGSNAISVVCVPDNSNNTAIRLDGSTDNFQTIPTDGSVPHFSATSWCYKTNGWSYGSDYTSLYPKSSTDGWYPADGNLDPLPGPSHYNSSGEPAMVDSSNPYVSYLCTGPLVSCTQYNGSQCTACYVNTELPRVGLYASKIVEAVTPMGQNKYWSGRVYAGSSYVLPIVNIGYANDSPPFGSIVPPEPVSNPYEWDGVPDNTQDSATLGIQPLYMDASPSDPNEVRAGTPYTCNDSGSGYCNYVLSSADPFPYNANSVSTNPAGASIVNRIFAEDYGSWHWQWDNNGITGRYISDNNNLWTPPTIICPNSTRPAYPNDYCAILPVVNNIEVNNSAGGTSVIKTAFVNLTFNSQIDSQQLPLTMYAVSWGDGAITTISGVEMRDRPNPDDPHSLYHLYDYWQLKSNSTIPNSQVTCGTDINGNYCAPGVDYCSIRPQVKIQDNWGWCSNGTAINDCGHWQNGPTVTVCQK